MADKAASISEDQTLIPASQFALETVIRRNRFQWLYIFLFGVITLLLRPQLREIPEWRLFVGVDVVLSGAHLYLSEMMLRPAGMTTRRLRLWHVTVPLLCFSMGAIVACCYVRFGFGQISLLATVFVSVYAIGALPLDRSNLVLALTAVVAYLWLPALVALALGGLAGYSVGFLLIGVLIFCVHQGRTENREFWRALHANRELHLARLRAEVSAHSEAKLIAERAQQNVIVSERSRIAAEWHDTLLAGFSAIGWQLDAAESMLPEGAGKAGQALALARTMLDHFRTEARLVISDLQSPVVEPSNLTQAISSLMEEFRRVSGVTIEVVGSGSIPAPSRENVHQLIRICQEAVANALKHGNPKRVTVRLESDEAAQLTRVEIADDGSGFDLSIAKPGHFGLAIMKDRANRLGGALEIRTAQGEGTRIVLTMPVNRAKSAPVHTKILLVEDQFFSRIALHSLCEGQKDLEIVAEANTGVDGIRMFQSHRPDLTILDLQLPDMSGYEVIKAVRSADPVAAILVLSNFDGADQVKRAMEAGASGYLTKNASRAELLEAIAVVRKGVKHNSTVGLSQ